MTEKQGRKMATAISTTKTNSVFHKYWVILSTRTQEDMAYRANYVFGAIFRFLPLVTTIFLWYAVYEARKTGGTDLSINGMSYEDMIAYYALMYVARGFSSVPGTMTDISKDIKDGLLNRYLIKPINYLWYQVMYRLAHKLVFWYVALFTFPPIFFLMRQYFSHRPTLWEWVAFVCSLVIAFAIGILFCSIIGMLAFWFLEISTFLFVVMMLEFFLSGHLIPLNILPAWLQPFLTWSPFGYEGYWPCVILMGKVPQNDLPGLLAVGVGWVLIFYVISRVVWKMGLKRYSAVGG
jgi:ABC-2 type transport system permease protein